MAPPAQCRAALSARGFELPVVQKKTKKGSEGGKGLLSKKRGGGKNTQEVGGCLAAAGAILEAPTTAPALAAVLFWSTDGWPLACRILLWPCCAAEDPRASCSASHAAAPPCSTANLVHTASCCRLRHGLAACPLRAKPLLRQRPGRRRGRRAAPARGARWQQTTGGCSLCRANAGQGS